MNKALFNTGLTAKEMLNILRKPYLTTKDITTLLDCSKTTAWRVISEIKKECIENGVETFDRCVKREAFLKWQGLTLEDYIEQAMLEKKLEA